MVVRGHLRASWVFSRDDIHKERHFFDRYVAHPFGPAECDLYHDWFPRPASDLTGEWTPDYMHAPWIPPLLAQAAPRDPPARSSPRPGRTLPFGCRPPTPRPGRLTAEAYQDAVARGLYHHALRRWTAHFPRDQILILQYERCRVDPGGQLARTHRFLGLEPLAVEGIANGVNVTAHAISLEEDVRQRLVDLYAPDVRALSNCVADLDLDLWPNFAGITVD